MRNYKTGIKSIRGQSATWISAIHVEWCGKKSDCSALREGFETGDQGIGWDSSFNGWSETRAETWLVASKRGHIANVRTP